MAADAPPLTDKQLAAEALDRMPESATLAEIGERLGILAGIDRGQADINAGRAVPHSEAEQRSREWTGK